jgi:hypothetical protein
MAKGRFIKYSVKELEWIRKHAKLPRRKAHELFRGKFGRHDIKVVHLNSLCKRKGWLTGRNGQFVPGQKSWNEGKKMPFNPNSARTQFKPGNLPHNTKYLGHERITKDGYIEISVNERNPHTGFERRYVLKHRHLWEKENGPVPKGMCLKALDGNRLNTDPDNWIVIPRGLLPQMNGNNGPNYQTAEPELRPVILTLARLRYIKGKRSQ